MVLISPQLKLDISELETLLDTCKRPKVKDALSITLRKFQTEFIALKEKEAEKTTNSSTTPTAKQTVSNGSNQPYDFVVKNYCTYVFNFRKFKIIYNILKFP